MQVVVEAEVVMQLVEPVCNPPLLLEALEIREQIGHLLVMTVVAVVLEEQVDYLLVEQDARLTSSAAVAFILRLQLADMEIYQALPTLFLMW
jgi:hypothetical protein